MMLVAVPTQGVSRHTVAQLLADARARTRLLLAPLSDQDLGTQHDPLMSPILWDLGHIAAFEELWLTQNLDGRIEFVEMPGVYNPFEYPRSERGALPLPVAADVYQRMEEIRARVLERLAVTDFSSSNPLLRDGYVYQMVFQHEYQHNETILQTIQLKQGAPYTPFAWFDLPEPAGDAGAASDEMVRFPGGPVKIGTDDRAVAYDNERPRHVVDVPPFWIDTMPVTNGDFQAFIAADGYLTPAWWSEAGWEWLRGAGVTAPKYWSREENVWLRRTMARVEPVDPRHPVCHVCYYEAEAFARFAGKRLPTEVEWETAASWDPATATKRTYPWGEEPAHRGSANLDQLGFGTAPVSSYPRNVSPIGCYGMIGDVWEWTSSDFGGYPGFEAFPYPEYSEAFFGSAYKVLRGGSWATRPGAIRNTFRNWDYPIRRQLFSGFRCARDA
jgi:iron(II)-dependent oxidoreductase